MQRASAAFGLLICALWLAVLAVGLAYVTVWAATQRRPQWRILDLLRPGNGNEKSRKPDKSAETGGPVIGLGEARPGNIRRLPAKQASEGAQVIPFDREAAQRRRKRAAG